MRLLSAALCFFCVAATSDPCNQGTTYDMRTCWSEQDQAANDALKSAYARVVAALRQDGAETAPLADAQVAWDAARDKTCAFEYRQYLPGTIAPLLGVQCDTRMTQARTQRLIELRGALQSARGRAALQAVSPAAQAQLDRIYGLYLARLTADLRASLTSAQAAWLVYRERACAVEGGRCLSALANERLAELKASWMGEVFW